MINIIDEFEKVKKFTKERSKTAIAIMFFVLGFSLALIIIDKFVLPMGDWLKVDINKTQYPPNCSREIAQLQEQNASINVLEKELKEDKSKIAIEQTKNASCNQDFANLQARVQSGDAQCRQKIRDCEKELTKLRDPHTKCYNGITPYIEKDTSINIQGLTIVFHGATNDGHGKFTLKNRRLEFQGAISTSISRDVSVSDIFGYVDNDNLSCEFMFNEINRYYATAQFSERHK